MYSDNCITKVKNTTFHWFNACLKTFHIISPENSGFIWILEAVENPNSRFYVLFCFALLYFNLPFILQIHLIMKSFCKWQLLAYSGTNVSKTHWETWKCLWKNSWKHTWKFAKIVGCWPVFPEFIYSWCQFFIDSGVLWLRGNHAKEDAQRELGT